MFEQIEREMHAEFSTRAIRPLRRATCSCGIGPDPDCAIDHEGQAEDKLIEARRNVVNPAWLAMTAVDELFDPLVWQFFAAGDDIEFCKRLRAGFARQAAAEQEAT